MRSYPDPIDEYVQEDLKIIKADQWQIEALKMNPSYPHWGNNEDYMMGGSSWSGPQEIGDTSELWGLDDLNECVNFYFFLERKNHQCSHCGGLDVNPASLKIYNDWYGIPSYTGGWYHNISDIEVKALVKAGRLSDFFKSNVHFDDQENKWLTWKDGEKIETTEPDYPTAQAVNEWSHKGFGHDSINAWICIKARANHFGVWGNCDECDGGYIYEEDKAKLKLQLWMIHPRKGCSRGVIINEITKETLPIALTWLKEARQRNQDRFSKIG